MKRKVIALATLSMIASGLAAMPAFADGTSHGRFVNKSQRRAHFQEVKRQQSMVNQYNNDQYLLNQQMQRNPYLANPYLGNQYYGNPYGGGYYYSPNNNGLAGRLYNWFY